MSPPLHDPVDPPSKHPSDESIEAALWSLLDQRATGATVCPSEVARALTRRGAASDAGARSEAWRALMPQVREVAQRLSAEGVLRVTRQGVDVIDATAPGGPIRLGRPPADDLA